MADPSAGGSSSPKKEPKIEYDEELDFFSYKFNPERALYSSDVSVPDPLTKSFESIKHYEDAIKARSKSKPAAQKSKTSETHVGSSRQAELVTPTKTLESVLVTASSSEASTSCDERRVSLPSKDKSVDRQRKLSLPSFSRAESGTTEGGALDLSLKSPLALAQAVSKGAGRPSATSLENYGNPSSRTPSRCEEKQYQTSVEDKIRMMLSSSRSQSSHEKPSTSSRNTESSRILPETSSRKSRSTASNDNSGHKLATNLGAQNWPSNYEALSPATIIKQESEFIYVPSSEKPVRGSGVPDERRSHSASSHGAEKQHFDLPRRQERSSSRDTPKLSRYKEKSPDVSVQIQERSSHASTYSQRPPGWRDDRRPSFSATERQEVVFDNRKNPKPGTSKHQQVKASDSADASKSCRPRKRDVFVRMENMTGPLRLLTRCMQEHLQVRVMTRGAKCVNSICRGYIVAFDKHFNMALVDVDEIYRRPVALGKVKSKRSKKLQAAQKTLQKERDEYIAKWNDEQSIQRASSSLQDLSLQAASSSDQKLSTDVSKHQKGVPAGNTNPFVTPSHQTGNLSSESRHASAEKGMAASVKQEVSNPFKRLSQSTQVKLRRIQSVYEGQRIPLSPFEREALMLGVADENVNHRHINKVFIRGENIASVSIIEDI
ncbi:hypothetical protein BsWGS_06377 [Bradybaena similaris]